MRRVLLGANLLLFAGGVLALVIAALYLIIAMLFGEGNSSATLYWLAYSHDLEGYIALWVVLAFFAIGGLFVIIVVISALLPASKRYTQFAARGVILAFFAIVLLYVASFLRLGPFTWWDQLQTITVNGRVYHLLEFAYDWTETHYYRFYECDRYDVFCQELYFTSGGWPNWPTPPSDARIVLVTDPVANTISLQVYGERVYTRSAQ